MLHNVYGNDGVAFNCKLIYVIYQVITSVSLLSLVPFEDVKSSSSRELKTNLNNSSFKRFQQVLPCLNRMNQNQCVSKLYPKLSLLKYSSSRHV